VIARAPFFMLYVCAGQERIRGKRGHRVDADQRGPGRAAGSPTT